MSIGSVIVTPTPTAGPLKAAISGFLQSYKARLTLPPESVSSPGLVSSNACSNRANDSAPLDKSAPAKKARPAPVKMIARTWSSWSARAIASSSSRCMIVLNAFSLSGRLSVMVKTEWLISYRIVS